MRDKKHKTFYILIIENSELGSYFVKIVKSMKLSLKKQFFPSNRNRNHVDILYLPCCNGEHRHPETFRRRKVQSRRLLCDNCELTAFKAEPSTCVLLRRESEKLNGGRVSGRVDVRGMCRRERNSERERERERAIQREKEGETAETHHQQLDLVNQRGRCKELVDGRQYFPFQRDSVSDVSSSRASGPDVRSLGTGQQLLAVARSELPLLQLFPRALVAPFVPCAPPHPQKSRSARVGIRTGYRLTWDFFKPLGHPPSCCSVSFLYRCRVQLPLGWRTGRRTLRLCLAKTFPASLVLRLATSTT